MRKWNEVKRHTVWNDQSQWETEVDMSDLQFMKSLPPTGLNQIVKALRNIVAELVEVVEERDAIKESFPRGSVLFFEPRWWHKPSNKKYHDKHPLNFGDRVYFLGDIPNVPGHCIVFCREVGVVDMIHPGDLRLANEDEL